MKKLFELNELSVINSVFYMKCDGNIFKCIIFENHAEISNVIVKCFFVAELEVLIYVVMTFVG